MERVPTVSGTTNLVDILDRVLDKGLVIAGDVRVSLANVELLTIRIRLLVCSVDDSHPAVDLFGGQGRTDRAELVEV